MNLNFTNAEIKMFLERLGYIIITKDLPKTVPVYHNQVETILVEETLAFHDHVAIQEYIDNNYYDNIITQHQIYHVFQRELKRSILDVCLKHIT